MDNFSGMSDEKTSMFHEGYNQVNRLNELWQSCNTLSSSGQLLKWKWKLDAIWRELSSSAHKKEANFADGKKTYTEQKNEHNKKIAEAKNPDDLYNALNDKEEFLKTVQDDVGKGTKWINADDDEIE